MIRRQEERTCTCRNGYGNGVEKTREDGAGGEGYKGLYMLQKKKGEEVYKLKKRGMKRGSH